MRVFYSPFANVYSTYTFAYTVYAEREPDDTLSGIYERGFLPYSGDVTLDAEIFYLARSLRVELGEFTDTSENRRVDRKIAPLAPEITVVPRSQFDREGQDFRSLCLSHAAERFAGGQTAMDATRLKYILYRPTLTHVATVTLGNKGGVQRRIGYVLMAIDHEILHYWFAFYDTEYASYGLGKWIMWRMIHWAKEGGLRYAYLGTCYTPKARYKADDFRGIQFFDGTGWSDDRARLNALCARDVEIADSLPDRDDWKQART